MTNPYRAESTPSVKAVGWRRTILYVVLAWCACIGLAACLGGFLSLFTGASGETPKWNGWSYFFFSVKTFALMGALLMSPIAVVASVILCAVKSPGPDGRPNDEHGNR